MSSSESLLSLWVKGLQESSATQRADVSVGQRSMCSRGRPQIACGSDTKMKAVMFGALEGSSEKEFFCVSFKTHLKKD